jgi:DnaJ-class molecular chaperone
MVKRSLLQTSWNSGSKYAAAAQDEGSIFDDFFGGGQAQKAKEKAQIVTEKKTADTKLTIEESKVLEYVAVRTS